MSLRPELTPTQLVRSLIWSGGELDLWELCRLFSDPVGHVLAGTAIGQVNGVLLEVRYSIQCTPVWETRHVDLEVRRDGELTHTSLTVQDGTWLRDGVAVEGVRGLVDVDLSISPASNTLPIRRLGLAVGQSATVTSAWVSFPTLLIQPLTQRYTRTGTYAYRYESDSGAFRAELEVDELGLVQRYGPYWRVENHAR